MKAKRAQQEAKAAACEQVENSPAETTTEATKEKSDEKSKEGAATAPTKEGLLGEIKNEIEKRETLMKSNINPKSKYIYDLKAVLIHIGTAYSGHYHAYIRGNRSVKDTNRGDEKKKEKTNEGAEEATTTER